MRAHPLPPPHFILSIASSHSRKHCLPGKRSYALASIVYVRSWVGTNAVHWLIYRGVLQVLCLQWWSEQLADGGSADHNVSISPSSPFVWRDLRTVQCCTLQCNIFTCIGAKTRIDMEIPPPFTASCRNSCWYWWIYTLWLRYLLIAIVYFYRWTYTQNSQP